MVDKKSSQELMANETDNIHLLTEITQSGVLVSNWKLLILSLSKYPDRWVFPWWRVNEWELWIDSLKRELKEEIGIYDVDVKQVITLNNRKTKDTNIY